MSAQPQSGPGVGIIFPSGMLGGGFSVESVKRGIAMGATAIAIDGGSTDSGPYYLGAGTAKTTPRRSSRTCGYCSTRRWRTGSRSLSAAVGPPVPIAGSTGWLTSPRASRRRTGCRSGWRASTANWTLRQ